MARNCYTIEKYFEDGVKLTVRYSDCVKSGDIKIFRPGRPNLKWKFEEKIKADINFEFIKKFVYELLFKDDFNKDEILEFMEKNLQEVANK